VIRPDTATISDTAVPSSFVAAGALRSIGTTAVTWFDKAVKQKFPNCRVPFNVIPGAVATVTTAFEALIMAKCELPIAGATGVKANPVRLSADTVTLNDRFVRLTVDCSVSGTQPLWPANTAALPRLNWAKSCCANRKNSAASPWLGHRRVSGTLVRVSVRTIDQGP
jgi:hypothetical protein